ncbi:MAG: response regulator transcription factor [Bacteroidota bacterium]
MTAKDSEIKIVLVDDHKLIVEAYESLLNETPNFKVIGKAYNGKEALQLIKKTKPHVILLDANMPVMSGFETLKIVQKKHPTVKVVVLTMHKAVEHMYHYVANGAHAFLGKECEPEELIKAINAVATEGYYFSSTVSKALIQRTMTRSDFEKTLHKLRLTSREIDILKLICEDVSNDDISERLNISVNTIKFFRKNIYKKTNAKSVIGLIKYALQNGIMVIE